jgi:hypothetical protein
MKISGKVKKLGIIVLAGISINFADLLVDDFANNTGINKLGGNWVADSDVFSSGSSTNTVTADGKDLVKGEGCGDACWAGHNIAKAYVDGALASNLKVSASVPGKNWAYAGWVMNFTK